MHRVLVLHGPNLNLLGIREPERYGTETLPEIDLRLRVWGAERGAEIDTFQSNHEGELIDRIHAARTEVDGIVINPGALTHSSYALHDALRAVDLPAVEVHISNIMRRERWRSVSITGEACIYSIYGRGVDGYRDALAVLLGRIAVPATPVRYGDTVDNVMDLRVPQGPGPHPTAVLLHGGFWLSQWTRDTIDGLAIDLAGRGWLTASVEYRRTDVGGGWPATGEDVVAALALLAARDEVDTDRVVLLGHSAGGQLALWASRISPLQPTLVIGLAPVTDLVTAAREGIGGRTIERFLGGSPDERPEAYIGASPIVRPPSGRQLLVHGSDDTLVPPSQSTAYAAAAAAAGADVEVVEVAGAGHFDLLDPSHAAWAEVIARLP